MPLTDEEVKALRLLFKEELQPFRTEMNKRFDEMATQIDGLYQRDEKESRNTFLSASRSNVSSPGWLK